MANSVLRVIGSNFGTLLRMTENNEAYEVDDEEKVELSPEQLDALKSVSEFGGRIEKEQGKSIHLSTSELVIRARNILEFIPKKVKANKIIRNIINKISPSSEQQDLPKKGFVKQVEEQQIHVDSAKAISETRERGGEERERRR